MSGWIKLEKSLESDPRVLRMARAIESRNGGALQGVTVVIGALSRIWMLADSHADSDDFLSMTEDELNDWIGVPDFCSLMPDCWLVVDDDGGVKLPHFQAHNGIQAKSKAQAAQRQEKHRKKLSRMSVTPRNGGALPDQDQDQDHTKTIKKKSVVSFDVTKIDGLDMGAWVSWVEYRAAIKKPLKPVSMEAAAKKLAGYGPDQKAVVDQSIANTWQGLFDLQRTQAQRTPAEPVRTWRPTD